MKIKVASKVFNPNELNWSQSRHLRGDCLSQELIKQKKILDGMPK